MNQSTAMTSETKQKNEERTNNNEKTSRRKQCNGFLGEKINELVKQSLCVAAQTYVVGTPFPRTIHLPPCFLNVKGASDLEFRCTDDSRWILVSNSCEIEYDCRSRNQKRCPSCSQYNETVKKLIKPAELDVANFQRLSERNIMQLAAHPEKIKALVAAVREQKNDEMMEMRRKYMRVTPPS